MKEESGAQFSLAFQSKTGEIREPIDSLAKKIHTKSTEDTYL